MDYYTRLHRIYAGYGVPTNYNGSLAIEFREYVQRQMRRGMTSVYISRGPEWSIEGSVREALAIDWSVRHGCSTRMSRFLPDCAWYDLRPSVLNDRLWQFRAAILLATIGRFNPYRATGK